MVSVIDLDFVKSLTHHKIDLILSIAKCFITMFVGIEH